MSDRNETYLRKIAGEDIDISNMPEPSDRIEAYLKKIAETGGGAAAMIAPDYADLTFPVASGDLCTHEGKLYAANQAISTSEEWTAAHWDETTVADNLGGGMQTVSVTGSTPSITAEANKLYLCGECSTLSVTPPESGIFGVIFESGTTPTVLTATGVTFPAWFDATSLEADTVYEISILEGYATVGMWEAS